MGEKDGDNMDVDNLLEQAFHRVEESDKNGSSASNNKYPMDDLIMKEAKKANIGTHDGGEDEKDKDKRRPRRRRSASSSSGSDSDGGRRGAVKEDEPRKKPRSSSRDKRSRSRDKDRDRKKRDSSRDRKKRSTRSPPSDSGGRSRKRSGSRDRKRRDRSRSRSRSRDRYGGSTRRRDGSRDRNSRPRRTRSRTRSRSPANRARVVDHRSSPPWRRSPPPRAQRLPGPERRDVGSLAHLDSLSMPFTARHSPPRGAKVDMSVEERDDRTIFILQLSRNTRPRDLEDFFSSVGHVRDVRIITDSKTRRSKGIAYVEFWEREAVPLAMGLNGQKLVGCPLVIQMTCAERNRVASSTMGGAIGFGLTNSVGPLKLQVSNLHPHINDDMLSAIFEPFGKVERCAIEKDSSGTSKGVGYVTFRHTDEGKRAMEQLNGFELAGKNIRLTVDDEDARSTARSQPAQQQSLESEDKMNLSSHGRLQLMAKLAEGTMEVPKNTRDAIASQQQQHQPVVIQTQAQNSSEAIPAIATQCFMLSNMFDPAAETEPGWELDVRDDVIEECQACVHIYVDKASPQGNVYVKCPTVEIAFKSVTALHGRWFAGKIITANYVPVTSYHDLFPDARVAQQPLRARQR